MTRPRTRLRRLIGRVGPAAFEAAKEYAWRIAAGTGRRVLPSTPEDEVASSVIHDVAEAAAYNWPMTGRQRVALLLALYRELPSYTVLMYAGFARHDLDSAARAALWDAYRALLDDPDDRLADPVAYSLWCDYFEGVDTVEELWAAVTCEPGLGRRGTERLLSVAGPVPWSLKAPLYERMVAKPSWHRSLLESLWNSRFDVYGQVEPAPALRLLDRLRLTADAPDATRLRHALEEARRTPAPRPRSGTRRARRRA